MDYIDTQRAKYHDLANQSDFDTCEMLSCIYLETRELDTPYLISLNK